MRCARGRTKCSKLRLLLIPIYVEVVYYVARQRAMGTGSRIVALVECADAMTSGFLYRQADEVVDNVERTEDESKLSG
jgi:hypothetical protein